VLASAAIAETSKALLIAQAFEAAQQIESELAGGSPPKLPSSRAEAAQRIEGLETPGFSRTLGLLVGTVQRVDNVPNTVNSTDPRVARLR